MYRQRQYVDHQSLPGCRVSRRPSGKRKNKYGLRCWQYGDAPCPRAYCGCKDTATNNRGNIRRPLSRSSSPRTARYQDLRRTARYKELATAKKSGCGPNCKYSRCAANDPCYARPFYEPKVKKATKRIERSPRTEVKTSLGAPVREIYYEQEEEEDEDDMMMEEMDQELRHLDEFPGQYCDQTCTDCSETSTEVKTLNKQSGDSDMGLKSLTMKTVACNTDRSCNQSCYYHPDVQTRVLKDVNSNSTFQKQTSSIPREKMLDPTPLPRVALLRPPRPASFQILTKKDRQMIRYALQKKQFPTPRPAIHEVFLYDHEALPKSETPSQPTSEVPLHSQFSQTSTPVSLTSRRESARPRREPTPRTRIQPQYQKWLPGKLSPRLVTPPEVKSVYTSQTPREEPPPQPQSTQKEQPQPSPTLTLKTPTPPESTPTPPNLTPPQIQRRPTPPVVPLVISTLTSDYDSDATTTSNATTDFKSSSRTPSVCLCQLCGKSQNASTATAAIYKNNNNPLYDIVSPMQSPSRMGGHAVATMGRQAPSRAWAWFLTLCEVV